jgi:hypothetical protein
LIGYSHRLLMAVVAGWLLLHLWFNWIEVVKTPVFPWDAWAVWVFRAKAWFAHSSLFAFITPEQWLDSVSATSYAAPALNYPWLVSLMPFWAALSLGSWHEALVAAPVAVLGAALTMAFYGQLRSHGLLPVAALVFSYFLLSTPLLDVHLSLAGYADIWMAGFAGLGFIALLRHLMEDNRRQLALGLLLLSACTLVKLEGLVWLMAALLLLLLCRLPLRWLATGAALLALLSLAIAMGAPASMELPGLGLVGLREGALHLPYLGSHQLVVYDQRWAYWDNAMLRASWSLAWLFAAMALLYSLARARWLRPVLTFLLIVVAVQLVIFVFSKEGEWAKDYTAINRLPLHVYPAVMFAVAVAWNHLSRPGERPLGMVRTVGCLLASALLVMAATLWWVQQQPTQPGTGALELGPGTLGFVAGGGSSEGGTLRVERFSDGIALLSSGPLAIDAGKLYLLEINLDYDWTVQLPEVAPALFWRRAENPGDVSRLTLNGDPLVDLSDNADWKGEIIEVGLLVLENQGQPAVLHTARIAGPSSSMMLDDIPREWFEFEPWTQRSANFVLGGAVQQHLPMSLLVACWVLLAMLLAVLLARRTGRELPSSLLLVALAGWMVLDVRWTCNRIGQFEQSWHSLRTYTIDERISKWEVSKYHDWLMHLKEEYLGDAPVRILLLPDRREERYYWRRTMYELLPHSTSVDYQYPEPDQLRNVDYVLYLGNFMPKRAPDAAHRNPRMRLRHLKIPVQYQDWVTPVEINPLGILARVEPPAED